LDSKVFDIIDARCNHEVYEAMYLLCVTEKCVHYVNVIILF